MNKEDKVMLYCSPNQSSKVYVQVCKLAMQAASIFPGKLHIIVYGDEEDYKAMRGREFNGVIVEEELIKQRSK